MRIDEFAVIPQQVRTLNLPVASRPYMLQLKYCGNNSTAQAKIENAADADGFALTIKTGTTEVVFGTSAGVTTPDYAVATIDELVEAINLWGDRPTVSGGQMVTKPMWFARRKDAYSGQSIDAQNELQNVAYFDIGEEWADIGRAGSASPSILRLCNPDYSLPRLGRDGASREEWEGYIQLDEIIAVGTLTDAKTYAVLDDEGNTLFGITGTTAVDFSSYLTLANPFRTRGPLCIQAASDSILAALRIRYRPLTK